MPDVVVSDVARMDLIEIGRFTQKRWGRNQRSDYVRMIASAIGELANRSHTKSDAGSLRPGLRSVRSGSHVIFFRRRGNGDAEVLRILHQRMDFRRHL